MDTFEWILSGAIITLVFVAVAGTLSIIIPFESSAIKDAHKRIDSIYINELIPLNERVSRLEALTKEQAK